LRRRAQAELTDQSRLENPDYLIARFEAIYEKAIFNGFRRYFAKAAVVTSETNDR
jgi:hypothetical protein